MSRVRRAHKRRPVQTGEVMGMDVLLDQKLDEREFMLSLRERRFGD